MKKLNSAPLCPQCLCGKICALLLLSCAGCQTMRDMGGFSERLADWVSGDTPRKSAVKMEDPTFPDVRRQGINELADRSWGKKPPYTDRYVQIAESASDPIVRATAIRALNRSRDRSAIPLFIRALNDESDLVRLEGAKALVNMPDPGATDALLRLVQNSSENRDVRIAAAEAVKHYHTLEVARTLIGRLDDREFAIAWQSRESLKNMTGRDLYFDEAAWLNYVTGPAKPFG